MKTTLPTPNKSEENAFELIYKAVKQIPCSKVSTYGRIAAMIGKPHWSRVVGYALHVNPDPENIPCYRVVDRNGRLSKAFAFGGEEAQKALLEKDGIEVKNNTVDLEKYLWKLK